MLRAQLIQRSASQNQHAPPSHSSSLGSLRRPESDPSPRERRRLCPQERGVSDAHVKDYDDKFEAPSP